MIRALPLTLILLSLCLSGTDAYHHATAAVTALESTGSILRGAIGAQEAATDMSSGDARHIRTSTGARCYPNPFRPCSGQILKFVVFLDQDGQVTIEAFNLLGNAVWTRRGITGARGENNGDDDPAFTWDGTDDKGRTVAAGGYIVRITTPDHTHFVKVAVQK